MRGLRGPLAALAAAAVACSSAARTEAPPPVAAEEVHAVVVSLSALESCIDGSRDELPPGIDPATVDVRALAAGARAARGRLRSCGVEAAAASVGSLPASGGQELSRLRAAAAETGEWAGEARDALERLVERVLDFAAVRARGGTGDRLVARQAEAAESFERSLERMEEALGALYDAEAAIRAGG